MSNPESRIATTPGQVIHDEHDTGTDRPVSDGNTRANEGVASDTQAKAEQLYLSSLRSSSGESASEITQSGNDDSTRCRFTGTTDDLISQDIFTKEQEGLEARLAEEYGMDGPDLDSDGILQEAKNRGDWDSTEKLRELYKARTNLARPQNARVEKDRPKEEDILSQARQSRELPAGSRFWALLIGINKYNGKPLEGCVNNVELIKKYLTEDLDVPADHIRSLCDESATRDNIINVLLGFRTDLHIDPDDIIIIYFAGHGSSYVCDEHEGHVSENPNSWLLCFAIASEYTPEQYKKLRRKMDYHLLPLMWFVALSSANVFVIRRYPASRQDGPKHHGNIWFAAVFYTIIPIITFTVRLTTVFYLTYMCFEFLSNILLQRWRIWKTLLIYMSSYALGSVPFSIQTLSIVGFFECCISSGFILISGSWYTRREHSLRSLVLQSANAGFGVIADLTLYGIVLGSLTIVVGLLCLYFLGTPSEVPWLTKEEKRMANTRILENQSVHDRTSTKVWKWDQVRECLVDPCFYFAGINVFLSSVPNGCLTTFGSIINTSFGFSSLQVILFTIPRGMTSAAIFVIVGLVRPILYPT
ncbi:hypothetical protein IW262DRAFT_1468974 [Armillaria fumosa]|nr:hypothetical protein IW262DRAFT_1468974 [Armillaria fumosa]